MTATGTLKVALLLQFASCLLDVSLRQRAVALDLVFPKKAEPTLIEFRLKLSLSVILPALLPFLQFSLQSL